MAFDFWGVSIHHALGGRPIWLVVNGHRNGPEAQANATIAGHRLNRILGGASGHFALDDAWRAYYTRCNEAVICASYLASVDPSEALRAAEAAKSAITEVCGGKLTDVTLSTLTKLTIEVQLAVRKAISGFGPLGKAVGGAGKVGLEQLLSITLSPDLPLDDSVSTAIRAANDVTNPGRLTQLAEVYQTSSSKSDAVGEGVRTVRVPAAAVENKHALHAIQLADHSVLSTIRCSRPSQPLLHLLPKLSKISLSPPPSPVRSYFATQGLGEEEEETAGDSKSGKEHNNKSGKANESMWVPSSEAAAAASAADALEFTTAAFSSSAAQGSSISAATAASKQAVLDDAAFDVDFGSAGPSASVVAGSAADFDLDFPAPAPLPFQVLSVRVAAQVTETVTLAGKVGLEAPQTVDVTGTAACKYVYGASLSAAVQDSGHGPVPFHLTLQAAGALTSLAVTPVGSSVATNIPLPAPQADVTAVHSYTVPVLLPGRPPNVQGNLAGDLCVLTYKYAPGAVPSLLKASASCRLTFAPAEGDGSSSVQHKHTDVILKSIVDSRLSSVTPAQVQFLVPLPAPPGLAASSADGPSYQPPLAKPQAQWSNANGKAQLLWGLAEQGTAGAAEEATLAAHFAPGKQAELKIRFVVPSGTIAPLSLSTPEGEGDAAREGAAGGQPVTVDGEVSAHRLSVQVAGILMKSTSQVRGLFRV